MPTFLRLKYKALRGISFVPDFFVRIITLSMMLSLSTLIFALIISCDLKRNYDSNRAHVAAGIVIGQSLPSKDPLSLSVVLLKTRFATNSDSVCTGVLVYDHYVLTAAHCVKFEQGAHLEVTLPLTSTAESINADHIFIHPSLDIALIKLPHPMPSLYKSLALVEHAIHVPLTFQTLGFGQQHGVLLDKVEKTSELRYVFSEVHSFDFQAPYFEVLQKVHGICFGDSGGPAVIQLNGKHYVIGIAAEVVFDPSRTFEPGYDRCLEKAIYLNVFYFKDWIEKIISVSSARR